MTNDEARMTNLRNLQIVGLCVLCVLCGETDRYGAANPISIGAFGCCVFTVTASSSCTLHELVFDLPDQLQAKFLRFFGANHETTTDDMDVLRNDEIRMSNVEVRIFVGRFCETPRRL